MLVTTLALGVVSYLVLGIGARLLSEREMASFVALWAVLNTMTLTAVVPVEHLAPRLMSTMSTDLARRAVFLHSNVLAIVAAGVALVVNALAGEGAAASLRVAALGFAITVGIWSGWRAGAIGSGRFRSVRSGALRNMVVAVTAMIVLAAAHTSNPAWLFLAVALGNLGGTVGGRPVAEAERAERSWRHSLLSINDYRLLGAMAAATFASLALNNGSLILARRWGLTSAQIVAYTGALNLVRVPYMLLNNVMAPMNLRFVSLARSGDWHRLRRLTWMVLAALTACVCVVAAGTALLGPLGARLLVGSDYHLSRGLACGVAVAEGLVWITVVPRLVGAALGATRLLLVAWGLGVAAFGAIAVAPIDATVKLVAAPVCAALAIVLSASVLVTQASPRGDAAIDSPR